MPENQEILTLWHHALSFGPPYNLSATSRTALNDTVIGGYQVPKDTTMVPVHYAMCMMDKYFKDPLEFK